MHKKGCLLETVQCDYHNVGCEVKMYRKDLKLYYKRAFTFEHRETKYLECFIIDSIYTIYGLVYQLAIKSLYGMAPLKMMSIGQCSWSHKGVTLEYAVYSDFHLRSKSWPNFFIAALHRSDDCGYYC